MKMTAFRTGNNAGRSALMGVDEVERLLGEVLPQSHEGGRAFHIVSVGEKCARMRLDVSEKHLRPGGTVSGPSMFALADLALYVAILANIGPEALAVTTNLNINFLSKPSDPVLIGDCRLLKLGKRLAVGEVSIVSGDGERLFAHATGTYSIPPGKG